VTATHTWDQWRAGAKDRALNTRLLALGCPGGLRMATTDPETPNPALQQWVTEAMLDGRILRTAQAELVSYGRSLSDVSDITLGGPSGSRVLRVIEILTIVPSDEEDA